MQRYGDMGGGTEGDAEGDTGGDTGGDMGGDTGGDTAGLLTDGQRKALTQQSPPRFHPQLRELRAAQETLRGQKGAGGGWMGG